MHTYHHSPMAHVLADLDVHAPLSPATTASLPSPPSLLPSPSARDDGPSPSDRPLSSFSTYTAASDLTEASFSGIRVSHAPGGGSTQVAAVLTSPSPTTTASLSSHTIAADPEGLPHPSPSHGAKGHEEPSFSGIRVKQAPGGGSAQMTGIFAAEKDGSQVANLPRGNQHNEESRDSGLHEEAVGRERRSSFSGIRVNQQPGGSSAHVAGILGGNRPSEETQEQVGERWHPHESGRRAAGASPAHGLEGEEEQIPSAFFVHDEGDADAAAFFAHDDEAALLDRFEEDETAQAAYPIRSVDGASAIESPPRARPPLSPSSLHEALVAESRSRGSTPIPTTGAPAGADATADARGSAVVSPSQDPQRPNGSVQQSESEEARQRRPSFSGIRVRQEPGGHSNQVAALLSDEATQERGKPVEPHPMPGSPAPCRRLYVPFPSLILKGLCTHFSLCPFQTLYSPFTPVDLLVAILLRQTDRAAARRVVGSPGQPAVGTRGNGGPAIRTTSPPRRHPDTGMRAGMKDLLEESCAFGPAAQACGCPI